MLSQYRIVETLGTGGMGVVVRARDATLDRDVALKFLSSSSFGDEQLRARFLREARVIAALNHPNICTIHAVGEVQPGEECELPSGQQAVAGMPFLALELIEGRTLGEVLAEEKRLPLDEILRIAIAVADGLAAAHAKGLVHRDLKPDNVMLTTDGRIKILDFGLAKPVVAAVDQDQVMTRAAAESAKLTQQGMIVGTVAYMSPEQASGKDLDERSDVFSFGVMLHEMIAGALPFEADTVAGTLAKILESAPAPIADSRPDLPYDLARIVGRCLRKAPGERFHDVRDLVVALRDLRKELTSGPVPLASGPVAAAAAPTTVTEAAPKSSGGALRAVAVVAVLAVVGLGGWWLGRSAGGDGESGAGGDPADAASAEPPPGPPLVPVVPEITRLTDDGRSYLPAISPDGRSVAYVVQPLPGEGTESELVVRDVGSGAEMEVARADSIGQIRWSPDGDRLAYSAHIEGAGRVLVVSRLGGEPRVLFEGQTRGLAWSPDGSQVLVVQWHGTHSELHLVEAYSSRSELVLRADEGQFIWSPDWEPGGERVVYSKMPVAPGKNERSIVAFDVATRTERRLYRADDRLQTVLWSPEADAIYYHVAESGGTTSVWRAELSEDGQSVVGEPRVMLSNLRDSSGGLSLDDSGHRGVYMETDQQGHLFEVSLDPGADGGTLSTRQLTRGRSGAGSPHVSPDGEQLVYTRATPRGGRVFVAPLAGGEERQLTFSQETENHMATTWSVDGRRIWFLVQHEGETQLESVAAGGGARTSHGSFDLLAAQRLLALPDGRVVGTTLSRERLLLAVDPETGDAEPLLEPVERVSNSRAVASPAGDLIAFQRYTRTGPLEMRGVWLLELQTGVLRQLSSTPDQYPLGFTPEGSEILALNEGAIPFEIVALPVDGSEPRIVGTLPPEFEMVWEGRLAPDGKSAVVSRTDWIIDVWMIEDWDPARPRDF